MIKRIFTSLMAATLLTFVSLNATMAYYGDTSVLLVDNFEAEVDGTEVTVNWSGGLCDNYLAYVVVGYSDESMSSFPSFKASKKIESNVDCALTKLGSSIVFVEEPGTYTYRVLVFRWSPINYGRFIYKGYSNVDSVTVE